MNRQDKIFEQRRKEMPDRWDLNLLKSTGWRPGTYLNEKAPLIVSLAEMFGPTRGLAQRVKEYAYYGYGKVKKTRKGKKKSKK